MSTAPTRNAKLLAWVDEIAKVCRPNAIEWCDGSSQEYDRLVSIMVDEKLATPLNSQKRPNCLLFRTDPSDVARVENRTYIASKSKDQAGPTNNWIDPEVLKSTMTDLYTGCMRGRTMYVIPFSMGPVGSPISKIGVEITDSPYVVVNMHIMTRVGTKVLEILGTDGEFIPCLHSVGKPARGGRARQWCVALRAPRQEIHFPFPRNTYDLVIRFRLWRQCSAWQEMPSVADCFRDGSR